MFELVLNVVFHVSKHQFDEYRGVVPVRENVVAECLRIDREVVVMAKCSLCPFAYLAFHVVFSCSSKKLITYFPGHLSGDVFSEYQAAGE